MIVPLLIMGAMAAASALSSASAGKKAESAADEAAKNAAIGASSAQGVYSQMKSGGAYNERVLGQMESMLGSDEQIAGTLGGDDPALRAYTQRFSGDKGVATSILSASRTGKKMAKRGFFEKQWEPEIERLNALMQQSEDAARSGNFELAEKLKMQAEGSAGQGFSGIGKSGGSWKTAFTLQGTNVGADAASRLGSKQAQTVGSMVRDARSFQDWESEGSTQFRARMNEGGERAIAAEAQGQQRAARDQGLMRGAGRMAGAAAAIQGDQSRRAATQRAQLHSQTNAAFESYRRQFAVDTTRFAREWLTGGAGSREAFTQSQNQIGQMQAAMYSGTGAQQAQIAQQKGTEQGAAMNQQAGMFGNLAGTAGSMSSVGSAGGK